MTPRKFVALANSIIELEMLLTGLVSPEQLRAHQPSSTTNTTNTQSSKYLRAHDATTYVDDITGW